MNSRNQGIFFLSLANNKFKQTWAIIVICSVCLFFRNMQLAFTGDTHEWDRWTVAKHSDL